MNTDQQTKSAARTFQVQLDFYWQSIALYALTLIVYVVVKALYYSQLQQGLVIVMVHDPVVVILLSFVALSVVALVAEGVSAREITIGPDFITFVNRFQARTFTNDEIDRIIIGKDRRVRVRPNTRIIRLFIKGRRRPVKIRPSLTDQEEELVRMVLALRHNHHGVVT